VEDSPSDYDDSSLSVEPGVPVRFSLSCPNTALLDPFLPEVGGGIAVLEPAPKRPEFVLSIRTETGLKFAHSI
jgi:hypothetical protein